jgi:hypothetical protein
MRAQHAAEDVLLLRRDGLLDIVRDGRRFSLKGVALQRLV